MSDREKVVEQLKYVSEWLYQQYRVVYDGDAPNYYEAYKAVDDAIALLKEQEAVKPKYTPQSIYFWECGVCAEPFDRIANYCPNCGRKVKWNE